MRIHITQPGRGGWPGALIMAVNVARRRVGGGRREDAQAVCLSGPPPGSLPKPFPPTPSGVFITSWYR